MSKKYDYRRVPSYRSLKIRDICRLYKEANLSPQTIRGWINNGELEAMLVGKTYYVYGAIFKTFLKNKSEKRKRTLDFNEFKCWHCKTVFKPIDNIVKKLNYGRNKSLVAYADCNSCGKEVERPYKLILLPEILKNFKVEKDDVTVLCDSLCSTRKTNINNEQKKPLCELSKSNIPHEKTKTRNSTKKAHINENQYSLF